MLVREGEHSLREYKIETDVTRDRREFRIRLLSWGAVLVLVASTVLLFFLHSLRLRSDPIFGWLAALTIIGAVVCAYIMAFRQGMQRFRRQVVILLSDKEIFRKRRGWPDVRIAFSQIGALYERPGWLVVESVEPHRRIAVPTEVDGFASLRTELAKHGSIVAQPQRSLLGFIPIVVSVLCWGVVLWSKAPNVVTAAAAIAMVLLAWESVRLYMRLRQSPKRLIVLAWVGLGWVAAILLVYFRVLRGS